MEKILYNVQITALCHFSEATTLILEIPKVVLLQMATRLRRSEILVIKENL